MENHSARYGKRWLPWLTVLLAVILVSLACGTTDAINTELMTQEAIIAATQDALEKADEIAEESAPPDVTGAPTITIINDYGVDICGIYIDPTTSEYWGANILTEVLAPGASIVYTVDTPDYYDVLAVDCSPGEGVTLEEIYEIEVFGPIVWTIGANITSGTGASGGVIEPTAPSTAGGETWTVMLYQDADDEMLEMDIYVDLNEAEIVGSSDQVNIISQIDRFEGGYNGGGNWTTTKRFYLQADNDLEWVNSPELADLGEVNMADMDSLVDFVSWSVTNYPADNYALILSDHGTGWPGGWSDPTAYGLGRDDIPLARGFGDMLWLMELESALHEIQGITGIDKLELIGFDACLMSHIEVYNAIAPYANYAVASQEVEPGVGWAYSSFLQSLVSNPGMSGADLGRAIVDSYITEDIYTLWEPELENILGNDITLATVDLGQMQTLNTAVDDLALAIGGIDQGIVAESRTYAQSYQDVFGSQLPPYIDLGNFAEIVTVESGDPAVQQAYVDLVAALNQFVVAEKHGKARPGSNGVSIYFPNSSLYQTDYGGSESYTSVSYTFAANTLWDDFLLYHYVGVPMPTVLPAEVAVAERSAEYEAPGATQGVEITDIVLSADTVTTGTGDFVTMSSTITGDQIAYIYFFAGWYNEEYNALQMIDQDYIDIGDSLEIGGIYYPDWGEGPIELEFEWEPIYYAIDDEVNFVFAVLEPEEFGETAEDATYLVEGTYVSASTGKERDAYLRFDNKEGDLIEVYGFTGTADGFGAPRQITPQPGDQFIVADWWLEEGEGDEVVWNYYDGYSITFTGEEDQVIQWWSVDADPGDYLLGFIVEDMEGNLYEKYTWVTVTE
ncbi:MAG: hypothetical protein JXJ17_08225 [Anaerolineae bacterium]|nr:hypothetical protein [Anaerolineae bacterium]